MIDTRAHANGPATLPRGHRWVVVDVETSGLRPNAHRVLSVAALVLREDGSVEREFSTLVNADCDPGPVHIHNLTRERLAGAPRFTDIAGELADILDGGTLVAHNASFDYGFLDAEFRRSGRSIPAEQRLCTLALSRRLELDVPNFKLATLARHWQVQQLQAHDAYDDARVLSEVFVRSATLAENLQLPLPVVNCRGRKSVYPDSVQRVPCQWKNPGRLTEAGLVQGMKVVISGATTTPRPTLAHRMTDAGLDVLNSASRQTSVVVCNDPGVQTAKVRKAMAEGIPVITEQQLEALLERVAPGEPKVATVIDIVPQQETPVTTSMPTPEPPNWALQGKKPKLWSGRRVLLLGGTHLEAVMMRSRIAQLGARPSLNFTAAVTDALLLDGADADKRLSRVQDRQLPVLTPDDVNAAIEKGVVPPHMRTESRLTAPVLSHGEVIDLPAKTTQWSVNIAWKAEAVGNELDVDVVAFLLDSNERVDTDDDFVFYNNPTYDDGAVELTMDGSSEQSVRVDLVSIPDECERIAIAAAIDGDRTFGDLGAVSISVDSEAGTAATAVLDAGTTERTMVLTEIYRRSGKWRLRAVGQGYDDDLAALAVRYGVDVEDND
ncbi:DNA polymerase-3 subunit epsilon [Rhodococcus sp. SMB37]|uniref:TerD family protein n=1 Tax=Rhodococcus sp. SMB37 TaxID=2512213 RepID=UPI0010E2C0CA|nr:TerD family protein [Rhodococcus sp. SMB37]TCN55943.1 DNA polymerase-3 subunit epsilon [Rhodococcus sp. SMB37]